jgi:hypothetical protein
MSQKRGKVFTWPVSATATLKAKRILLLEDRKCELSAKVRLAGLCTGIELSRPTEEDTRLGTPKILR